MTKQHKYYEAAFKLEVARMVVDQGLSIGQVVNDMGVGRTAVNRWVEQYRAEQKGQSGRGQTADGRTSAHPPTGEREPPTAFR